MDRNRWTALDRLSAAGVFRLPQAVYAELAVRLREAGQDKDPGHVRALAGQLAEIFAGAIRAASPAAQVAARRESAEVDAAAEAFALGQLGFAYQVAADLADKRVDAQFEQTLASATYAPYVRALIDEDMTGIELAARLGQRVETVSRNLKVLRAIGAVDYHRDQTSFINFLTPAARHLLERDEEPELRSRLAAPIREWAKREAGEMPGIWREVQTFAQEPDLNVTGREEALADD